MSILVLTLLSGFAFADLYEDVSVYIGDNKQEVPTGEEKYFDNFDMELPTEEAIIIEIPGKEGYYSCVAIPVEDIPIEEKVISIEDVPEDEWVNPPEITSPIEENVTGTEKVIICPHPIEENVTGTEKVPTLIDEKIPTEEEVTGTKKVEYGETTSISSDENSEEWVIAPAPTKYIEIQPVQISKNQETNGIEESKLKVFERIMEVFRGLFLRE